jgi:uncharacterized membrane protein HdeD (DUF308 family)
MATQVMVHREMGESVWLAVALRGLLAIAFGVFALAKPGATTGVLVLLFAIWSFVDCAAAFVVAARRGRAGARWGWTMFEGLVSLAAGVVALSYPRATLVVLTIVVAIRAMMLGVLGAGAALAHKDTPARWLRVITGVVSVIFGFMLLGQPMVGALAIVWALGVYAIIVGVMMLGQSWQIHARESPEPHEIAAS